MWTSTKVLGVVCTAVFTVGLGTSFTTNGQIWRMSQVQSTDLQNPDVTTASANALECVIHASKKITPSDTSSACFAKFQCRIFLMDIPANSDGNIATESCFTSSQSVAPGLATDSQVISSDSTTTSRPTSADSSTTTISIPRPTTTPTTTSVATTAEPTTILTTTSNPTTTTTTSIPTTTTAPTTTSTTTTSTTVPTTTTLTSTSTITTTTTSTTVPTTTTVSVTNWEACGLIRTTGCLFVPNDRSADLAWLECGKVKGTPFVAKTKERFTNLLNVLPSLGSEFGTDLIVGISNHTWASVGFTRELENDEWDGGIPAPSEKPYGMLKSGDAGIAGARASTSSPILCIHQPCSDFSPVASNGQISICYPGGTVAEAQNTCQLEGAALYSAETVAALDNVRAFLIENRPVLPDDKIWVNITSGIWGMADKVRKQNGGI